MLRKIITIFIINGIVLGQVENIAVFDFSNNGINQNEVRMLSDRLRTELVKYEKFNVVDRSKIDDILKEQELQLSGCVDECLIEVGKILGATSIVSGSIGKVGNYYTINARKINATTSKIEQAISYDSKYSIDDLLIDGMQEIAKELLGLKSNQKTQLSSLDSEEKVKIENKRRTSLSYSKWDNYTTEELKQIANTPSPKVDYTHSKKKTDFFDTCGLVSLIAVVVWFAVMVYQVETEGGGEGTWD